MNTATLNEPATVLPIALQDLQVPTSKSKPLLERRLELLRNVKVALQVRVGETELTVDELMALKSGSVITFPKQVNEPLELLLDGAVVACGELVAVGDALGFKLTEVSALSV